MNQFQDYTKAFSNMAMNDTYQKTAANMEKAVSIALNAASEVVDINDRWAKDTLARAKGVAEERPSPENMVRTMQDYASSSWEASAQYLASYTEVARKAQMDAVELAIGAAK
ncbi:MAG: hypothetical protein F4170_01235 [Rhodobacteraceae bacterium]|nr:hypothetical protein [Paracoccaceae bacterium]